MYESFHTDASNTVSKKPLKISFTAIPAIEPKSLVTKPVESIPEPLARAVPEPVPTPESEPVVKTIIKKGDRTRPKTQPKQAVKPRKQELKKQLVQTEHEKVETGIISTTITAKAGEQYKVQYEKLENIDQARRFIKNPEISILNITMMPIR